ncbi:hypothetical protein P3X46_028773 [Hevea brasiliensis]|uniref:Reverse transcriptase domain-containing protein n=1 Tax=Hevea brasiliensis TaxID=3981 RepID=A0ABQ9KQ39_HEVBR|nr:hypothetical protein P3X46_028773 [Hevea brasiliensis]
MAVKIDMHKAYDQVDYSILVNRAPTPPFYPSKGLRQWDPLSSYLFLFVSQALSCLINREHQLGHFKGFQFNIFTPTVTNILFADDTLIFGRATRADAKAIKEILAVLEMHEMLPREKYLGLPSVWGRSKAQALNFVEERIGAKTQSWQQKLSTQASREILIKSVLHAIPAYSMAILRYCHTLPLRKVQNDPVVYLINYRTSPTDNSLNTLQGILNNFNSF